MRLNLRERPMVYTNIVVLTTGIIMVGVFWFTNLDMRVAERYRLGDAFVGPENPIFSFFYYPLNAVLFVVPMMVGMPLWLMSFSRRPFFSTIRRHRRHAALLMLGTLILAGVLNSIILKSIFARPRPYVVLAGDAGFYRPFEIVRTYWGAVDMSFPSGHASVAFALFGFYFAFQHAPSLWRKLLKWGVGVVGALTLGVTMSLSRAAYGDHFLSDGLFAGALMYCWLYVTYHALSIPERDERLKRIPPSRGQLSAQDVPTLVVSFVIPIVLLFVLFTQFDGLRSW